MQSGQQSRYKGSKGGVLFDDLKMKATDIIQQSLFTPIHETPRETASDRRAATSMGLRSSRDSPEHQDEFPLVIDTPQDLCSFEDPRL